MRYIKNRRARSWQVYEKYILFIAREMQPEISFHTNKVPEEKFLITFLLVLLFKQAGKTCNFSHAVREMMLGVECKCLKLHFVGQFDLELIEK